MNDPNRNDLIPPLAPEDFWLELGPSSAYVGMDCYETALKNGDLSPDGRRLGAQGAESPRTEPEKGPHKPLEEWDDVPPMDR